MFFLSWRTSFRTFQIIFFIKKFIFIIDHVSYSIFLYTKHALVDRKYQHKYQGEFSNSTNAVNKLHPETVILQFF